jgi:hypothetical protein
MFFLDIQFANQVRCLEAHRVAHRGAAKNFDVLYLAAKAGCARNPMG